MRQFKGNRDTNETKIEIFLNIDGGGEALIDTGIGFFDHMLHQTVKHGFLHLKLKVKGDTHIDFHHTVEDVGLVLGKAIKEALGSKEGIKRYAIAFIPMDEALSMVAIDISGRPYLHYDVNLLGERIGNFEAQLVEEFFRAVAMSANITLHVKNLYGKNNHHIVEGIFKAFGICLREAATVDEKIKGVRSTKGIL